MTARRQPRRRSKPVTLRTCKTDADRIKRAEWITAKTRQLYDSAIALGMTVTGDWRVSADDAARLIGCSPGTLKNNRTNPDWPTPARTFPITYSLRALATWAWNHSGADD